MRNVLVPIDTIAQMSVEESDRLFSRIDNVRNDKCTFHVEKSFSMYGMYYSGNYNDIGTLDIFIQGYLAALGFNEDGKRHGAV